MPTPKTKPAPEPVETTTLDTGVVVTAEYKDLLDTDKNYYTRIEDLLGRNVFVRTVTMYFLGQLVGYDPERRAYVFVNATWIASTGRWTDFLVKGVEAISECESYPYSLPSVIKEDTIVDWNEWRHALPDAPKSNS